MSSYTMVDLRGKVGIATDTVPLVWEASIDASEISALTIAIVASAVSAGVNVGNPATVLLEHSFDDGASWITVLGTNGAVVTGAGTFLTAVSLVSGLIAPLIRVTLAAPAGQSVTVSKARKNRFLPGTLISFAGSSFLGGVSVDATLVMRYGPGGVFVDTEIAYDTTTPANTRALPARLVNDTGGMDFGSGAAGAQTPRAVLATRHEAAATPLSQRLSNGAAFADYDAGGVGANVLRTTPASDSPHLLATRHETVATPLATRLSDGTDFLVADAIAAAQKTLATATKALDTISLALGWDGSTHREIAVDTAGRLTGAPLRLSSAYAPVLRDFSSSGLLAATWSQYIASTSAESTRFQYVNESGYPIELSFGAGGAEATKVILAESGEVDLLIPLNTRLALRCASAVSTGNFWISAFI